MIKYMYGKCGVKCDTCPAYFGNITEYKDQEKCSKGWKKYLNISLSPKYCKCNGCQAEEPWKDGNVIPDRSCLVRKCCCC